MDCHTIELLRPFQSTRDLDGIRTDREEVQDIAYDGMTVEERMHTTGRKIDVQTSPEV